MGSVGNPQEAAAAYETSLFDWTEANLRRTPDRVFIDSIDQGKTITHRQFGALGNRIAQFLKSRGIGANDRVAMLRSEEHTSELQSLMRSSYAVFCLKKKKK